MIKTGLIGNGYWGKKISDKLDKLSNKIFIQTTSNYNTELFRNVDWVFIATPASTHFKIAKDAIEEGVNVFLEKPFCSNTNEAVELIRLAQKNKIFLYVDNVFLYRSELQNLIQKNYINIFFSWRKNGPFNDTLINDLLYHDLYLLIYILGKKSITKVTVEQNKENILVFSFFYGESEIKIDYNRALVGINEKIIYADNILIKFGVTKEDPLGEIISSCLSNEMDFELNNMLNLETIKILDELKMELEF